MMVRIDDDMYVTFIRLLNLGVIKDGQYIFERKYLACAPVIFHVHVGGTYDKRSGIRTLEH